MLQVVGDRVEIQFFPADHDRSLRGVLGAGIRSTIDPDRFSQARAQAWGSASLVAEVGVAEDG